MHSAPTWWAAIYVGLREGYDGEEHLPSEARAICAAYCERGLCVTVTPTTFVYTGGAERGVVVGLINYPRFPKDACVIEAQALELAELLRRGLGQTRVSVQMPYRTVMLEDDDAQAR